MQRQAPVIPATQEAEAGELLESACQRLQWAKIAPVHSSLGDRVRFRLKKTKNKKQKKQKTTTKKPKSTNQTKKPLGTSEHCLQLSNVECLKVKPYFVSFYLSFNSSGLEFIWTYSMYERLLEGKTGIYVGERNIVEFECF